MSALPRPVPLSQRAARPLCVDCDGTLIQTDLLHEAVFLLLHQAPWKILLLPLWLLRGKAYMKERLADVVVFNWAAIPYRSETLALIAKARAEGRPLVLVTASAQRMADGIARHLGLFDEVHGSRLGVNLGGQAKADFLTDRFGHKGFDYVGDSVTDLPVWRASHTALVVDAGTSLSRRAGNVGAQLEVVPAERAGLRTYLRAIRIHQWLKNLLVFVPVVAGHRLGDHTAVLASVLAFTAFSFCASAVYVLNDLLDLPSDRAHVRKRHRPFASGRISILNGVRLGGLLMVLSIATAFMLPPLFGSVLAGYFAITLAYSLRLKREIVVDVLVLAMLYTVRILAGSAATAILPSFWLLAFSMFAFLSLALIKRYSEMLVALQQNKASAAGRGYTVSDLAVLMSLGASAGMTAVMILALYINSPDVAAMYPSTHWLWAVPPLLLYWVCRMWTKAHRGEVHDDPIVFAVKDWHSMVMLLLCVGAFFLAGSARL